MSRAMFSPIIRSTRLYLQYLVVFTQVAASWCPEWVETHDARIHERQVDQRSVIMTYVTHRHHNVVKT